MCIFLEKVVFIVCECGGIIINVDVFIIVECFKVGLYCEVMCFNMVEIFGIIIECCLVKVMMNEKIGFVGCEEGIVVIVIVIVIYEGGWL